MLTSRLCQIITLRTTGAASHTLSGGVNLTTAVSAAASTYLMGLGVEGRNRTAMYPNGVAWKWNANQGGENQVTCSSLCLSLGLGEVERIRKGPGVSRRLIISSFLLFRFIYDVRLSMYEYLLRSETPRTCSCVYMSCRLTRLSLSISSDRLSVRRLLVGF